ncbi:MAG: helix-hairpin-helix domain-containing protein [Planctomycetota bacterium]|nr:helix-hairpin-helix domain-containing protein [Planctomycetota bacterium]
MNFFFARQDESTVALLLLLTLGALVARTAAGNGSPIGEQPPGDSALPDYRVDLNRAAEAEFQVLPGIGRGLARKIVQLRTRLGAFRGVDQLLEVNGIGPKKLQTIRDSVIIHHQGSESCTAEKH